MHWQKIIEFYDLLPENERTSVQIAFQMRANAYEVDISQICKVLKHTKLEECIDIREIRAAAKVLRTLVDFTIQRERPDIFDASISLIIGDVMDGLPWHNRESYEALRQIRNALSHIVSFHYEAQQEADHSTKPASSYHFQGGGHHTSRDRMRHLDDDIEP